MQFLIFSKLKLGKTCLLAISFAVEDASEKGFFL